LALAEDLGIALARLRLAFIGPRRQVCLIAGRIGAA